MTFHHRAQRVIYERFSRYGQTVTFEEKTPSSLLEKVSFPFLKRVRVGIKRVRVGMGVLLAYDDTTFVGQTMAQQVHQRILVAALDTSGHELDLNGEKELQKLTLGATADGTAGTTFWVRTTTAVRPAGTLLFYKIDLG